MAQPLPKEQPKFFVLEVFHCDRIYSPDVEGGTYTMAESEVAKLIEKGMTHHLRPANQAAADLMPSIDEMTRGDLRAMADAQGINHANMKTEELREAVRPKKADSKELSTLSLEELQALAKDKGVDSKDLTKKKLIEAIQAAE